MLPKNGEQQNHIPQEWGSRAMLPMYGEQELGFLGMGSSSEGWQKSWIQIALDPVLDYGPHKESQAQIDVLSLKDNIRTLFGPEAN